MAGAEIAVLNEYLSSRVITKKDFRFIHCPEVVTLYYGAGMEDEMLNEQYERIKRRRAELFAKGDFRGYITLTARPYRLDALLDVIHCGRGSFEGVARLLVSVWLDSEFPGRNARVWRYLFSCFRSSRVLSDTKKHLPSSFKVWRGGSASGLSWSLSEETACWFANRYDRGAEVHCREVSREEAVCYLDGRGEKEIILLKGGKSPLNQRETWQKSATFG